MLDEQQGGDGRIDEKRIIDDRGLLRGARIKKRTTSVKGSMMHWEQEVGMRLVPDPGETP